MPLSKNLRREPSIAITVGTTTFNAPGIYYPPYGKSVFLLSGRGSPGNAKVPGNATGNTNSTLYYYYQPASGGNEANINPGTGGNYVGEAATPGTYAGTVAAVPAYYNPYYPGTYNGSPGNVNQPSGGYTNPDIPGNSGVIFFENYAVASVNNYYISVNYYYSSRYIYVEGTGANVSQPTWSYQTQYNYNTYDYIYIDYYYNGNYSNSPTPGNYNGTPGYTNPAIPGNVNADTPSTLNPYYPAYDYYNPPGAPYFPYYNPYVPGNPNYNPYVPASTPAAYNTGNPVYNPDTPGNAGTNYSVLGIPLPGGAADTAAPVIGYSAVQVSYVNAGVPISVPPGGYVAIQNKRPNT